LEDLVQQIQNDQRKRERDKIEFPFTINFYNPNIADAQSLTGPNSRFIQSQLIIDYLLEIPLLETNKNKFISLCKENYRNNDTELRIIQEFEHTYSSTRCISWYTRNCFLNRILTKALQIENLSLILDGLFFLRDIQQEIEINRSSSIHRVYRCQLISKDELGILYKSLGQFISINTFLSASPDRPQALSTFQNYETSDNLLKVLFEIDTNPQFHGIKPFADITSLSFSSNIKEILFMIGSIFRLDNLRSDQTGLIIISLTKYHQPLLDHVKKEYIPNKKTLLSFGHLFWKLNRFDDAEKCYYHLIEYLPEEDRNLSKCYHALGNIANDRDDYETSLEWHEKSLDIKKSTLPEFDSSFAFSYNSIGAVYHQKGDYTRALEFYQQALDIWMKEYDANQLYVAMCYNNMGLVYEEMGKCLEALGCYEKVLIIRQKILPNDHVELGDIHKNLGIIYQSLSQLDLALKSFNQSLIIFKKSRPANTAMVLNNIGNIYENKCQLQDALSHYQLALTINRQWLPDGHDDIVQTKKNIEHVMAKVEN
jgi:tetratricopeptide (TPR) repeat protein